MNAGRCVLLRVRGARGAGMGLVEDCVAHAGCIDTTGTRLRESLSIRYFYLSS